MQNSNLKISNFEKLISILSYFSMGIIGAVLLVLSKIIGKKLKPFLFYNIIQSMVISIILALFKILFDVVFSLIAKISFFDAILAFFNYIISVKIIRFNSFGISFTFIELLVILLLLYICLGIILGRIFFIPYLSDFMNKIIKK